MDAFGYVMIGIMLAAGIMFVLNLQGQFNRISDLEKRLTDHESETITIEDLVKELNKQNRLGRS